MGASAEGDRRIGLLRTVAREQQLKADRILDNCLQKMVNGEVTNDQYFRFVDAWKKKLATDQAEIKRLIAICERDEPFSEIESEWIDALLVQVFGEDTEKTATCAPWR